MAQRDPRVDAFIARAQPFARPILERLREDVHAAVPGVAETLKWRSPWFEHQGLLCGMMAFTQHCRFGFWKTRRLRQELGGKAGARLEALQRIQSLEDLPAPRTLRSWIRKAARYNEEGLPELKDPARRKPLEVPGDLERALRRSPKARRTFEDLSPSHRREYLEWILEARRPATRERRIATTVEWLKEGKTRNWKYR